MLSYRNSPRRAAAAAVAAALAVGSLAACGNSTPGGSGGSGDGRSLTYWSMWKQGEDQQKVLQRSIDEFTAKTGVKVDVQWAGRQVLQQVMPRLNSGKAPDLVDQDSGKLTAQFAPTDAALGLRDVYDATPTGETRKISELVPGKLVADHRTRDGQPLVVPYELLGVSLWFNEVRDPGLTAKRPGSWDEFTAKLDELKAKGRAPLAVEGDQAGYQAYWYIYSLTRHGGAGLLNKAGQDKTGATFDDPAFLAAAKDIEKLIKGAYFPKGFTGTKYPAQQNAWADGSNRSDFLLMGTWGPGETGSAVTKAGKDLARTVKFRSMPFPAVDGGKGNKAVQVDTIGFAIPKKARNADAAKKFIKFFLAKDQISGISTVSKNLTPRTDVTPPADLADFAEEYAASDATFTDSDGLGLDAPKWVTSVWSPLVTDFFNGKYDAAGFVKAVKEKSVTYYKSVG
ncbi:ABC transporter substrate-binding protein [Streptomyces sp. NPDC091272]|uniref:ABC transporter substrate-binding protein n=1 Tax=Streptomyces sp. NPDC091272 TaxID=3365981 RepID=UPI0038259055